MKFKLSCMPQLIYLDFDPFRSLQTISSLLSIEVCYLLYFNCSQFSLKLFCIFMSVQMKLPRMRMLLPSFSPCRIINSYNTFCFEDLGYICLSLSFLFLNNNLCICFLSQSILSIFSSLELSRVTRIKALSTLL